MTKWQYVTVTRGIDRKGIVRAEAIDFKELPDWEEGPDWAEYINELGENGWELAAVDQGLYVFKRTTGDAAAAPPSGNGSN